MKTTITVIVTLLIGAAIAGGIFAATRGRGKKDDATAVRIEPIERGKLIEIVQSPGEVQPRTKVSISAKIAARIVDMPVKEGDPVKKGDVLVKLDSTDLEAILRSARARYAAQQSGLSVAQARVQAQKSQVEGLQATLLEAERDLERQQGLLQSKDVSQSVVDAAQRRVKEQRAALDGGVHNLKAEETNLEVIRHQLEAADAEIARAQEDLSYTNIVSPLDGVVTTINAKVGELVVTGTMNNAGTVIMEVADLSEMLVLARVDETDVANVKPGQPARVHMQAYPDRVFEGKVITVALARTVDRSSSNSFMRMDEARVFKVEILLQTDAERIYSGLTADVEIETNIHQDVLKVPSQCVLGRATDELPQSIRDTSPDVDKNKTQTTVIYRVVDGKAVVSPVKVGPSDISHTIILSGAAAGEQVITGPYKVLEGLKHDQAVKKEAPATNPATKPS